MLCLQQSCCCSEQHRPSLSSIEVYAGTVVHEIKFLFNDEEVVTYGNRGGFRRQSFMLLPEEILDSVTCCRTDHGLMGIQFTSSSDVEHATVNVYEAPIDSFGIVGLITAVLRVPMTPSYLTPPSSPSSSSTSVAVATRPALILRGFLVCTKNHQIVEYTLPSITKIRINDTPTVIEQSDVSIISAPASKTGILVKESVYFRHKNVRYVVLDSGHLYYYLDKSSSRPYNGIHLRGKLDLSLYLLSKSHRASSEELSFCLLAKDKKGEMAKRYVFFCKSFAELEEWESAIVSHMRAMKSAKKFAKEQRKLIGN